MQKLSYRLTGEKGGNMDKSIEEIIAAGGAKCKICGERMLRSKGCKCSKIIHNGRKIKRIKFGMGEYDSGERCHDCNTSKRQYHHYGCDMEICPVCGEQLIGCECDIEFAERRNHE